MAKRGYPSTAHEYDRPNGQCLHCGMYKNNVEFYKHACTAAREREADARDAKLYGIAEDLNDHGE
jgi:hypothetical protein